jgi:hypothetical protein
MANIIDEKAEGRWKKLKSSVLCAHSEGPVTQIEDNYEVILQKYGVRMCTEHIFTRDRK